MTWPAESSKDELIFNKLRAQANAFCKPEYTSLTGVPVSLTQDGAIANDERITNGRPP